MDDGMALVIYIVLGIIGIAALLAILRLFSISNDVKAIREHLTQEKGQSQVAGK